MKFYLDHIFDHVDPTIHLDDEQQKVVTTEGDLLVIAGAGSGKTTTMVAKVKYLIEIKNIDPKEILLISYTNKATEELKERIMNQFQLPISILTFHKLGMLLLKQRQTITIKTDIHKIVDQIIKEMQEERKWKWKISFFARKYKKGKRNSLVCVSEKFIKNYKMKGRPSLSTLNLSNFWKQFLNELITRYDSKMRVHQWIDFEDMIFEATKLIQSETIVFPYRYIIVDEYQDISKDRFLMLQAIKKKFDVYLIVVGDDWQSIFGFSGSEIQLFTQFQKFFPNSKQLKITNTYRNSQELINIAGRFVMKNSMQIKKQLTSSKHISNPILLIPYTSQYIVSLKKILSYIATLRERSTVFLLGRYHQDFAIEKIPFLEFRHSKIYCSLHSNLRIEFLTVHSAKGLGADEVIILNCNGGIYGFPTNKKTDPILKRVETIDQSYPYAEERRLFYVALTRTKNHVFILYSKKNKSVFIKELKKDVNVTILKECVKK